MTDARPRPLRGLFCAALLAPALVALAAVVPDVARAPRPAAEAVTLLLAPLLGAVMGLPISLALLAAAFRLAGPHAGAPRLALAGFGAGVGYLGLGALVVPLGSFLAELALGLVVPEAWREAARWARGGYMMFSKAMVLAALLSPPAAGAVAGLVYARVAGAARGG